MAFPHGTPLRYNVRVALDISFPDVTNYCGVLYRKTVIYLNFVGGLPAAAADTKIWTSS